MNQALIDGFLSEYDGAGYPEDFLARYEPLECLAYNSFSETLLVKDKQTGECLVAKCYLDMSLLSRENESELLRRLHHAGLPAFISTYQNGGMLCVLREYADGVPLDVWRRERPRTRDEIISVGAQICDILAYIHAQTPPVIHRDLKPQNIIIDGCDRVKLIDFGISRTYHEDAEADTVCFGTMQFAPPEQYGFSQTDCRADIFSLGVVLRYLLTGQTDARAAAIQISDRRLNRIIEKCTAFSPDQRYACVGHVKRALLGARACVRFKTERICAFSLACAFMLAAGFALGRHTDFLKNALDTTAAVEFREPLIERAVRQSLGLDAKAALAPDDVARVTELYIWGDSVASGRDEYYSLGKEWGAADGSGKTSGSIVSLEDAALLPNLRVLMLANQQIEDISPLSGLRQLTDLDLDKNPVRDVSAIRALSNLEFIGLNETQVSDLSPLASCRALTQMVLSTTPCDDFSFLASMGDIEYLHVMNIKPSKVLPHLEGKSVRQLNMGFVILSSMADLKGIRDLQELYLDEVYLNNLNGIETLPYLTHLWLKHMTVDDLSPLLSLPYLKQVELDESLRAAVGKIQDQAKFNIVFQ